MTNEELQCRYDEGSKALLLSPAVDGALYAQVLQDERELRARGIYPKLPDKPAPSPQVAPVNEDK